jgi:hypothetical protein
MAKQPLLAIRVVRNPLSDTFKVKPKMLSRLRRRRREDYLREMMMSTVGRKQRSSSLRRNRTIKKAISKSNSR